MWVLSYLWYFWVMSNIIKIVIEEICALSKHIDTWLLNVFVKLYFFSTYWYISIRIDTWLLNVFVKLFFFSMYWYIGVHIDTWLINVYVLWLLHTMYRHIVARIDTWILNLLWKTFSTQYVSTHTGMYRYKNFGKHSIFLLCQTIWSCIDTYCYMHSG